MSAIEPMTKISALVDTPQIPACKHADQCKHDSNMTGQSGVNSTSKIHLLMQGSTSVGVKGHVPYDCRLGQL